MPQFFGDPFSVSLRGGVHRDLALDVQPVVLGAPELRRVDDVLDWMGARLVWDLSFERAMVLRASGDRLTIAATVSREPEQALRAHRAATLHPVELRAGTLENEMLRRRAPALVLPDAEHDVAPLVTRLRTGPYVAAPVEAFGQPVATLHANRPHTERRTGDRDRATIGAFAALCGSLVERALLFEELAELRTAVATTARHLTGLVEEHEEGPLAASRLVATSDAPSSSPLDALTRREREVLDLMGRGATSREIAAELVVSIATVKSHAQHILSKLGARTRAEAVARANGSPGSLQPP